MKNDHGDVGIVQLHLGVKFLPYIREKEFHVFSWFTLELCLLIRFNY